MSRAKSPPETWRECRGCKRMLELTLANFAPHKTGRNGWQPKCRQCMTEFKRAWRKLNPRYRTEPKPLKPGQVCDECFDLGHRRPADGCSRCRQPYESLPPIELVTRRSFERAV
jgi:hypothetical protein